MIKSQSLSSIPQLSQSLAESRLSPVALVDALLRRIDEREPVLHAWAYVARDEARQAAAEAERELSAGRSRGPLHGIPFGVKDIYDTAGMPTRWGSTLYADRVPGNDAALVALLKQAGAVVLGKTHTTAFAYYDAAPTRNPHNPEHTPGGSSSGSAAAVADGMVPFALGSQTQGSVLRPASFCGVVGFKPSFGALPPEGMLPFAPTLDHPGLFTRTVEEMAWLWGVLGNHADTAVIHRRLSRPPWPTEGALEPEMVDGFEKALDRLRQAGFEVVELVLPATLRDVLNAAVTAMRYEGAQIHKDRFEQYGKKIGEKLALLIEEGMRIDQYAYREALAKLEQARQDFANLAGEHPVWVTPSALGAAPRGLGSTGDPRANTPFTALGAPSVSLPFGRTTQGLPLGLQLVAAQGQETKLLATARECEQALP